MGFQQRCTVFPLDFRVREAFDKKEVEAMGEIIPL
jgi:hypothetical protein